MNASFVPNRRSAPPLPFLTHNMPPSASPPIQAPVGVPLAQSRFPPLPLIPMPGAQGMSPPLPASASMPVSRATTPVAMPRTPVFSVANQRGFQTPIMGYPRVGNHFPLRGFPGHTQRSPTQFNGVPVGQPLAPLAPLPENRHYQNPTGPHSRAGEFQPPPVVRRRHSRGAGELGFGGRRGKPISSRDPEVARSAHTSRERAYERRSSRMYNMSRSRSR